MKPTVQNSHIEIETIRLESLGEKSNAYLRLQPMPLQLLGGSSG